MTQRVTIHGRDSGAMADLVRRHHIDVMPRTAEGDEREGYRVDALVEPDLAGDLEAAGYRVEVIDADVEATADERRKDIDWHDEDRPGRGPRGPVNPIRPNG